MGFLDKTSITVDAVLTKKGRELLKSGTGLKIENFTVSDTTVDYTLWNPNHPSGSTHYGEAIENSPQFEASVHSKYSLRNRLITLPPNTISIPALEVRVPGSNNGVLTLDEHNAGVGSVAQVVLKGYAPGTAGTALYAVMSDPAVANISNATLSQELDGIGHSYARESGIESVKVYKVNNSPGSTNHSNVEWLLNITAGLSELKAGRSQLVTLIEEKTGAVGELRITNNITKLTRNMLGPLNTKG